MEHVLIELRQNEKYQKYIRYPDVCFEIGDKQIKANKCLLASKTDYFVKLFTYHPEINIKLTGFEPDVFEYIILLLYNKKMPINKVEDKDKLFLVVANMHEMMIDIFRIEHIKKYISTCNSLSDLLNLKPYINEKDLINYTNNTLLQNLIRKDKAIVRKELFFICQLFSIEENIIQLLPLVTSKHLKFFKRDNISHYNCFIQLIFQNWMLNLNEFPLLEYLLRQIQHKDIYIFKSLSIDDYYPTVFKNAQYLGFANYKFKKETMNNQEYIACPLIYRSSQWSKSYYLILPLQCQNLYYKEVYIGQEDLEIRHTKINHIIIIEEINGNSNSRTIKCNESIYASKLTIKIKRKKSLIQVEYMEINDRPISSEEYDKLKYYIEYNDSHI